MKQVRVGDHTSDAETTLVKYRRFGNHLCFPYHHTELMCCHNVDVIKEGITVAVRNCCLPFTTTVVTELAVRCFRIVGSSKENELTKRVSQLGKTDRTDFPFLFNQQNKHLVPITRERIPKSGKQQPNTWPL